MWPILLGIGALALLLLGFLALRGRRRHADEAVYDPVYDEPVAAEPEIVEERLTETVVEEPVAAPVAAVAPAVAAAESTDATRPWLDLSMRPVSVAATGDEAVFEIELFVGNTGGQTARDVRVSTWMFAGDVPSSDMEQLLIENRDIAAVEDVTLQPGDGANIAARMALPRASIDSIPVRPIVLADARYTLPDGSEGRTSAAFEVGVPEGDHLGAFSIREEEVREGVEARLDRVLERA